MNEEQMADEKNKYLEKRVNDLTYELLGDGYSHGKMGAAFLGRAAELMRTQGMTEDEAKEIMAEAIRLVYPGGETEMEVIQKFSHLN